VAVVPSSEYSVANPARSEVWFGSNSMRVSYIWLMTFTSSPLVVFCGSRVPESFPRANVSVPPLCCATSLAASVST
jgi:hypothetical protein